VFTFTFHPYQDLLRKAECDAALVRAGGVALPGGIPDISNPKSLTVDEIIMKSVVGESRAVQDRILEVLLTQMKTGLLSRGVLALALENPDVAIQVVGQKVNEFVDSVGSEVSGFVGGLFSAVTFGVVDAVLDAGMSEDRKEILFDDVDHMSGRAFRRQKHSSVDNLNQYYCQKCAQLSHATAASNKNEVLLILNSWSAYEEIVHQCMHDWLSYWVNDKGYACVKAVVMTIVNCTTRSDIHIDMRRTSPSPVVVLPSPASTPIAKSSKSDRGRWSYSNTKTLLFGIKGGASMNDAHNSASTSSNDSSDGSAANESRGSRSSGPRLGVKLRTNLFQCKLFANGAALLLPTSEHVVVSIASRRQFHDFTELTMIVADRE